MTDKVLDVRRRVFFFGKDAGFHCHVHEGKRGKWRWSVKDVNTGRTIALSPVLGWGTAAAAEYNARQFFEALDVELTEVSA